jgi:hypothetical protein
MDAALLAFYLPDHPPVFTAGKYLGKRSTTFDQWPDTNLESPALLGRTMLLVGPPGTPWADALNFDHIEPLADDQYLLGINYRGPRVGAAHLNDRSD